MLLLSVIWFHVLTTLYAQHSHQHTNKTGNDLSSRIWYGEKANIKDYPYFAALANCGAAILSERWLATAAHCVDGDQVYRKGNNVWVGQDGLLTPTSQHYTFNKIFIYPHYWMFQNEIPIHDIALLKLTRPLRFSNNVKPVKLPEESFFHERNAVYAFAGRGKDETGRIPDHLMAMSVHNLEVDECVPHFHSDYKNILHFYSEHKKVPICVTRIEDKPGLCNGDSGSPLVQGNTLVGLASFINDNCSEARLGMFTNVAPFVGWIKQVTGIQ